MSAACNVKKPGLSLEITECWTDVVVIASLIYVLIYSPPTRSPPQPPPPLHYLPSPLANVTMVTRGSGIMALSIVRACVKKEAIYGYHSNVTCPSHLQCGFPQHGLFGRLQSCA